MPRLIELRRQYSVAIRFRKPPDVRFLPQSGRSAFASTSSKAARPLSCPNRTLSAAEIPSAAGSAKSRECVVLELQR